MFSSDATRELRANNPLGVSVSSTFAWQNVDVVGTVEPAVPGSDGNTIAGVDNKKNDHLVIFQTIQDGLNAAAWLLWDNYFQAGFNTPASIGNRWAGDKTGSYGQSLALIMGYDTNQQLDYGIDGTNLMKAMAIMENGHGDVENIPDSYYAKALIYGQSPEEIDGSTTSKG